jgi:nucleotide-binding universal stress UspA family protein
MAFSSIMVGIDFSPVSRSALRQAARIAAWSGSTLHATHVVDKSIVRDLSRNWQGSEVELDRLVTREVALRWSDFAKDRPAQEFDIRIDERVSGVLRAVESRSADLLVLGVGAGDFDGSGRMVESCIRRSAADVLAVYKTTSGPFQKVLAAVDFSDLSRHVVARAAYIAAKDSARLVLLHVSEKPWRTGLFSAPGVEAEIQGWTEQRKLLHRQLVEFFRPWLGELPEAAVEWQVETDAAHGSGIASFARETDADLIVLGTRPAGNLHDRLFGSTGEKVLREARCCVLAVRPRDAMVGWKAA